MNFDAFWLAYLKEHRKAGTRACHYVVTVLGLGAALGWAAIGQWIAAFATATAGYGLALAGHFLIERNRPYATRPLWGFYADLRMMKRAVTGQLRDDLRRALT